ncbi:ElyC/SanA/YdcF family protein [Anderseniella sp. Alg231-50]|uniref:ElyC/SanA/YdcF family protein n=1 Tax=Anderseniella sp. Alg231-50 TaxID=1922226 RepID=UPI000D552696
MSLFLDKIIPLFVYPVGFAVLAGLACLFSFALGRRRKAMVWVTLATLYLWLAATPIVALKLINSLEEQYPIVNIDTLPKADVAIVLGGVTVQAQGSNPYTDLKSGADRILHAARLLKAGKVDRILVSSGRPVSRLDSRSEAEVIAGFLREFGVDDADIVLESESRNTRENAVNSLARMREDGFSSAILVTSALHMPRAAAVFRKAGVTFSPASIDPLSSSIEGRTVFAFLPNSKALDFSTQSIKEWIGMLVYQLRGWA